MPKPRTPQDPTSELNLAPLMNMVVILIPLLLLAVVFLQVGVVNVSTPKLSPGVASDGAPDESLNLTVAITEDGFVLSSAEGVYPGAKRCEGAPTICNVDGRHDWVALYNTLAEIKRAHPDETTIQLTADPDVEYATVIRVMDVARFKLTGESYRSDSEFWSAHYAVSSTGYASLFPDPVLTVAR